ncbi:MAG: O-antigen ligase family protein [Bacteroidaceae bacterium]|nr:O-antigen ligase family protein [Bacteroidaceae bacterium]
MDILLVALASFFILRKRKLEWTLVIIMALGTNLFHFSKFFNDYLFIPNTTDGALLLILLISFCYRNKRVDMTPYKDIHKVVKLFLVYLASITLVDLVVNGTPFVSVVKTSRHWLCLLILFVIPQIPYNTLYKTLRITFYITLTISALIIFEYFAGTDFFTRIIEENGIKRGALPTYYALLYTFLIFTDYYRFSKIKKYLYLGILIASQLVSTTRSISLAIVLGIAVCIWYLSTNKFNSFLKLGGLCIAIYVTSFALPSLHERFNEAFDEISGMEQSSKNLDAEGNTTFRLYMVAERYQYLKTNPQYYLLGIGNVIEQEFPTIFMIGGYNKEMRRPTQLDTGDISWSPIILRLGILGLVIYLIMTFKFITFQNHAKKDLLCITTKTYLLITLIVISFASSTYARGEFWIMPMICIVMVSQVYMYNDKQQLVEELNKNQK